MYTAAETTNQREGIWNLLNGKSKEINKKKKKTAGGIESYFQEQNPQTVTERNL